jgi:hypothetical protein
MKKSLLFSLMLVGLLVSGIFTPQSMAAVFHVTNATEFQSALTTAASNGEDDIVYLAAGTYAGNFSYLPPNTEYKALTIQGEPGLPAAWVVLDGQNSGRVLTLLDMNDCTDGPVPEVRISGMTFQNGNTTAWTGGMWGAGIAAGLDCYNISITNCIITDNTARGLGGGVYMGPYTGGARILTLDNNLIGWNTLTDDMNHFSKGAGAYMAAYQSDVIIRNNIIVRNSALGVTDPQGGGLWVATTHPGNINLIGNTIYNNQYISQANKGGGVYFYGGASAYVYNNIIYGNIATEGGDLYFEDVTSRVGYNNNYSSMYGTWTDFGGNLDTDPLFLSDTNNDFRLQPTSPMVNAGATAVPTPPGFPSTDFEGNPRVMGPAPDIGAYESFPVNPSEGTIGTEIVITGSGYGSRKGKVLVGTASLKILEWTDTRIRGLLSKALPPDTYDVTIRPPKASAIVLWDSFTVSAPAINYVDPTSGEAGDTITISGYLFGTKKGKVTLGGKSCKVTSWTMSGVYGFSEIVFIVPKGLTSGTKDLRVINGVGSDTTNFTVE